MRLLMSNMAMVIMVALLVPIVTGDIVPAKNRWAVDEDIADGFCTLTYDGVDAGGYACS
ncbi:MAG: hypothetical protein HKO13_01700 [Sphingomonas sp.]|nr:hypothetical protein [Sphingomonas sp.]